MPFAVVDQSIGARSQRESQRAAKSVGARHFLRLMWIWTADATGGSFKGQMNTGINEGIIDRLFPFGEKHEKGNRQMNLSL
jgi:hypothetical protein